MPLSAAIGGQSGIDPATLAVVAQNGSTWVGGGTLVIWSTLIAVAGITGVSVTDLARKLFLPVAGGLVLATTAAASSGRSRLISRTAAARGRSRR